MRIRHSSHPHAIVGLVDTMPWCLVCTHFPWPIFRDVLVMGWTRYMPAASFHTPDRSCTWTDLASIGSLVNASLSPQPSENDTNKAEQTAAANQPLYFDAVTAPDSDEGGAGVVAQDATGGRKLHPMVAASKSAHAVDRYERAIYAPQPRLIDSYTDFPVTPWKHKVYAATWFSLSAGITLMWVTSSTQLIGIIPSTTHSDRRSFVWFF